MDSREFVPFALYGYIPNFLNMILPTIMGTTNTIIKRTSISRVFFRLSVNLTDCLPPLRDLADLADLPDILTLPFISGSVPALYDLVVIGNKLVEHELYGGYEQQNEYFQQIQVHAVL